DSLAIGIQPSLDGDVPTNQGYVDDLYALLRLRKPGLKLAKLGCSGETSDSMVNGGVCSYPQGNQLNAALAFIETHKVAIITLDIGGNDVDRCVNSAFEIDQTCLATGLNNISSHLPLIVEDLRETAGPNTPVIAMNYFDPFLAAWKLGPAGQTLAQESLQATIGFNGELEAIYQAAGVPVADVAKAFRITDSTNIPVINLPLNVFLELTWTWVGAPAPLGPDIHPNSVGYANIALAFAETLKE
ncbi:MAG TPA: SGNH/GDSL hydrolase family protein, partial [Candidatus Acidoferrales bacterium]|nr:SGNH/GDSL hydrolase family protein [Candidatus Acidoferrales bacterium]